MSFDMERSPLHHFAPVLGDWFDEMSALYHSMPAEDGLRGAIYQVLEAALRKHAPHEMARFTKLRATLPKRGAFSFVPARDLLLLGAFVCRTIIPRPTLQASTNAFIEQEIGAVLGLPLYVPMIQACDGNLHTLLQLLAQGHRVIYNYGEVAYDRLGSARAVLSYEKVHSDSMACVLPGFFRGTIRSLDAEPELHFERLSDHRLDIVLSWS